MRGMEFGYGQGVEGQTGLLKQAMASAPDVLGPMIRGGTDRLRRHCLRMACLFVFDR